MDVILIFDIGKTNKKVFLFNKEYKIVYQKSVQFEEISDENGEACENLDLLQNWVLETYKILNSNPEFKIVGANVSTYGASLVYIDENLKPILPLYNYLRVYPENIKNDFLGLFEDPKTMILETASPNIGSLSAGMQVFRIKKEQPEAFKKIKYAVHLPQYKASLLNHNYFSDFTSIGCHTHLWNFNLGTYHTWVTNEDILEKFPKLVSTDTVVKDINGCFMGIGIHDSSSALIPYIKLSKKPFVLISTGTWCVSMNPFNNEKLTPQEIDSDTLFYMSFTGIPVKSSKVFLGDLHERETLVISKKFNINKDFYKQVTLNKNILKKLIIEEKLNYNKVNNEEEAYHLLIMHIVSAQIVSTNLIIQQDIIKNIYVDGGFSKNEIYLHLLAKHFANYDVFAAETAQASALGAALVLHECWQQNPINENLISLKKIEI